MRTSNLPPMDLEEIRRALVATCQSTDQEQNEAIGAGIAADTARHFRAQALMAHSRPSPSSLLDCARQQWFKAQGVKPEHPNPPHWFYRRALGTMSEVFWNLVLGQSHPGLGVQPFSASVFISPGVYGWPDGQFPALNALVEFKCLSGWGYNGVRLKGVREAEPGHYMQVQLYMHGAGWPWCLYLACLPDLGLMQNILQREKRYQDLELPFFYLEWIRKDDDTIDRGLERIAWLQQIGRAHV